MPTLYEDQQRLTREENLYKQELQKTLRRAMWISIFLGVMVSTALLTYAWVFQKGSQQELVPLSYVIQLASLL